MTILVGCNKVQDVIKDHLKSCSLVFGYETMSMGHFTQCYTSDFCLTLELAPALQKLWAH